MTALRSAKMPVGSTAWIRDENAQVAQFCAQEIEDFTFSARNELEWLNEHMADIFSKNQVNVTEIFKTPGKLRGKTPRTAKKRNPLESREPLTDIFSANAQPTRTPTHHTNSPKPSPAKSVAAFQVAEDHDVPSVAQKPTKANTDSGYHGLSEDDMENDGLPAIPHSSAQTNDTVEIFPRSPLREQPVAGNLSEGQDTTERSFHSAQDDFTGKTANGSAQNEVLPAAHVEMDAEPAQAIQGEEETFAAENGHEDEVPEDAMEMDIADKELEQDLVEDESRSPSQGSSPARPLIRKSSLTFAALPAREPLTTKKSIGARVSRTSHLDQSRANLNRGSFLGRFTGGKSLGGTKQSDSTQERETNDDENDECVTEKPDLEREESDADSKMTKLHNKSSTQRLHDRINMLGKSQPARPTKSIPLAAPVANPSYPELPTLVPQQQHLRHIAGLASEAVAFQTNEEDDDDWIQPPQPQQNTSDRPQLPKSLSVDVMEDIRGKQTISDNDFDRNHNDERTARLPLPLSPIHGREPQTRESALLKAVSASRSTSPAKDDMYNGAEVADVPAASTTPMGSPSPKRYVDGPLSASKSKLQSIMKTARGLFSSSAGVSAQAKMETLSPPMIGTQRETQGSSINAAFGRSSTLRQEGTSRSPVLNPVDRKTRSSTEKEEKRKELVAREQERTDAESVRSHKEDSQRLVMQKQAHVKDPSVEIVQQHLKPTRQSPRKTQNHEVSKIYTEIIEDDQPGQSMGPPSSHTQLQQSQTQKPKETRRPIKPTKEAAPKPKPQPVAIRVGTISGMRMNNSTLSSNLQESLPPPQPKLAVVVKKPSNATLHTSASTNNLKTSVTSATTKPKALIAAERKKEQDEKEAQRKLEQKREIERKRAAQQEEARKQEQLQRHEGERQRERERAAASEDPKIAAKKQAIEKRRLEMRKDQQRVPQRPGADHATTAPQAASTSRQELAGPRPPSRLQNVPDHHKSANNQPVHNSTKPLNKRVFDPDADDEPFRPSRLQGGPAHQQPESKRRKTDDEEAQEVRVRPTMAPPIRQSGIRQGGFKPSIFNSSYTAAPPPASHHLNAPSLLKSTTASQAYQQHAHQNQISRPGHHPDIAKYQNGRIPFADNPNPPHPSQPHKTPQSRLAPQAAKSSPQYVNGENIHLDDIPTESEDESDSDSGSKPKPANLPDWAQSPNLRDLLMTQDENMDADAVFGPVQSPHMEEMFRERHHRFRSRTSSANWAGADRLTEEEIRRDVEARQRLRREGGWTFGL